MSRRFARRSRSGSCRRPGKGAWAPHWAGKERDALVKDPIHDMTFSSHAHQLQSQQGAQGLHVVSNSRYLGCPGSRSRTWRAGSYRGPCGSWRWTGPGATGSRCFWWRQVDPGRYRGSCYRGANWIELGSTRGGKRGSASAERGGEAETGAGVSWWRRRPGACGRARSCERWLPSYNPRMSSHCRGRFTQMEAFLMPTRPIVRRTAVGAGAGAAGAGAAATALSGAPGAAGSG